MAVFASFTSLPRVTKGYVACVVVLGGAAIVYSFYDFPRPWWWLLLPLLTLISGSITVKVPSTPATLSVSEVFVFLAVFLFNASAGTLTVEVEDVLGGTKRHLVADLVVLATGMPPATPGGLPGVAYDANGFATGAAGKVPVFAAGCAKKEAPVPSAKADTAKDAPAATVGLHERGELRMDQLDAMLTTLWQAGVTQ